MSKVSYHGGSRLIERNNNVSGSKDARKMFDKALKFGKSPANISDIELRQYLVSKTKRGAKVKLYDNTVFIYKGYILITSYKLPERFTEEVDRSLTNVELVNEIVDYISNFLLCISVNLMGFNPEYKYIVDDLEEKYTNVINDLDMFEVRAFNLFKLKNSDFSSLNNQELYDKLEELLNEFKLNVHKLVGFGSVNKHIDNSISYDKMNIIISDINNIMEEVKNRKYLVKEGD